MWRLLQQQKVYSKKLKSALLTGAIVQCSDNIDVRATSSNSVVWLLTNIVYSEMWFSIFTTKRKMKHVLKVRPLNPCLPLNIHQNSECLILTYAHLFQIGQLWYVTFRRHQLFKTSCFDRSIFPLRMVRVVSSTVWCLEMSCHIAFSSDWSLAFVFFFLVFLVLFWFVFFYWNYIMFFFLLFGPLCSWLTLANFILFCLYRTQPRIKQ